MVRCPWVVALLAALTGGCSDGLGSVRIDRARLSDDTGTRVGLELANCGGDNRVADVVETDDEVRVLIESGNDPAEVTLACQDGITIQLARPLGNRVLIDLSTATSVAVD